MKTDPMQIKLASIIVHLCEHIETGEPMDLEAAKGTLSEVEVRDFLADLKKNALLPVPRQRIQMLRTFM